MSTNKVFATYQEIYDVNTELEKVSLVGIHTPVGAKPRQMLAGFFQQYRKYRYLGCSCVGTSATTLPLQLGDIDVNAGESGANPRDIWNPILFHGCHGDNLNSALNSIYKGTMNFDGTSLGKDDFGITAVPDASSGLTWEQIYYRMLQDPSFRKYKIDRGFKLPPMRPMVYNVASTTQIMPSEVSDDVGQLIPVRDADGVYHVAFDNDTGGVVSNGVGGTVFRYPAMITNRLQSLGWLDTRQVINSTDSSVAPAYTVLPRQFMGLLILPPAYRMKNAIRIIVTHYWAFKEFNTSLTLDSANEYYNWLTQIAGDGSKVDKMNNTLEAPSADIELISDMVC